MTEASTISIKAQPVEDPSQHSITFLIKRLLDQKGAFRNVTEESLEAEIQAQAAGSSPSDEGSLSEDEAESRPEMLKAASEGAIKFAS